jgi:hypothetical protein
LKASFVSHIQSRPELREGTLSLSIGVVA